jgi:hypothetical protein
LGEARRGPQAERGDQHAAQVLDLSLQRSLHW